MLNMFISFIVFVFSQMHNESKIKKQLDSESDDFNLFKTEF